MATDPDYPSVGAIDAVYQGARGAFSEDAAILLLRAAGAVAPMHPTSALNVAPRLLGMGSLHDLSVALQSGLARYAVVPVHNSIVGDVPGADTILRSTGAHVVAETTLPIVQCLVAPSGTTRDAIRRVVSHPVALAQCRRFLDACPQLRIESHDDTAGALKMLVDLTVTDAAAIASARAAHVWRGVILRQGIQDSADNFTTFVLLEQRSGQPSTQM